MTPDPMRTSVANVAAAGERLRMELLDTLRRTEKGESAGVRTELMLFYGQAFGNVRRALPDPVPADLLTAKILHECVCGMAIYRQWLVSETALDALDEHARMTTHWRTITGLLLRADEE
jgi:hypothetical protein